MISHQFDVIIVGDSEIGNYLVKTIAGSNRLIKTAFISKDFKKKTTHDFLNVEYIKNEVIFTDYKNRLFGCYLASGERYYCTHLIIATGVSYSPMLLNNKPVANVFNTITEVQHIAKQQVAIVIGAKDTDIKFALAVAKKYKYVYLCVNDIELDTSDALLKKLEKTENLLLLKNTSVTKVTAIDDDVISVSLDNYAKITCNAIFIKTNAFPETAFVSDRLVAKDCDGYIEINNMSESTKVPKCFAAGNCVKKNTKKQQLALVETILKDFNGG